MANSKQAAKRARTAEKRRARNRTFRSMTRTMVKSATVAIDGGDEELTAAAIKRAISSLDRAASKGVIHPNNAARRKSRLQARYNKAVADA